MSRTADPLERLRAANPVASLPTVDWEQVRRHLGHGAVEPRDRRLRLLAIGGTSCAAMLALAVIAVVLLSSASSPSRAPSFRDVCDRAHENCLGGLQVGVLTQGGVLSPLPNASARPAAAQACAVIGPRCARGCVLPVASPLRSSLGLATSRREDLDLLPEHTREHSPSAGQGCTAKTTEPCSEDVAGAATRPRTGKALRELLSTERLLQHATPPASASPPACERLLFRDLLAKRFPHRTQKRR
jgi:hypothetical protein